MTALSIVVKNAGPSWIILVVVALIGAVGAALGAGASYLAAQRGEKGRAEREDAARRDQRDEERRDRQRSAQLAAVDTVGECLLACNQSLHAFHLHFTANPSDVSDRARLLSESANADADAARWIYRLDDASLKATCDEARTTIRDLSEQMNQGQQVSNEQGTEAMERLNVAFAGLGRRHLELVEASPQDRPAETTK